ncbi:Histone deacetylase 6 [Hondaea fermentalgiana]|uniref:histone deacetylase n=1 Tax=Hondaea fermentalgiana TaxID=2315210 RepID=A0A2R5GKB9_9STRA|nr:Histone deacetylase 6 [Hondaea fermentalgiana]|eukprot:GBG31356.1 Histone deacetylase 6 [Hondaea fermentalgiana]
MSSSIGSSNSSGGGAGRQTPTQQGQTSDGELDRASCVGCGSSVVSGDSSAAGRSHFAGVVPAHPLPVLYHQDLRGHCTRLHGTLEVHQEGPERVHNIFLKLFEEGVRGNHVLPLVYDHDVPLATREQLLMVHDAAYVDFLEGLCVRYNRDGEDVPSDQEVLRFSPLVVSRLFSEEEQRRFFGRNKHLTSATRFSQGSFKAAMRAAGSVVRAVEIVLGNKYIQKRCFCLVRPPGHHAGPRGYDPVAGGCGFCIVNNVCVGVAEALRMHPGCRIAIVDLDVHHGNGTQTIVQERFAHSPVIYCSIHLHETFPGEPDMDFFPGTGAEQDDLRFLNIPLAPLWNKNGDDSDTEMVVSGPGSPNSAGASSGSGETKRGRTRTGFERGNGPHADNNNNNNNAMKTDKDDGISGSASAQNDDQRFAFPQPKSSKRGRAAWRRAVEQRILPRLKTFQPDLLFISAGFDGSFEDEGCSYENVSGLDLTESDFAWATEMLVDHSGVDRVVSVLEGGYGRWMACLDMYETSSLTSCVLAHIAALVEKAK